ncbi:BspA family leucine-rich repeat surface protein [Lentilactobacillus buchneri]|uniref:DUF5776 domain-containing protein n=1 Tax=Lentilactobacillus buchneri TaxID=1581 RepID=UPI0021A3696B|nr:DUF5776 domain-containing protein [Lentilactobacillus buchneri]MCT2899645.1 BspA family leucine-rich repeat surface protein [Lentilactobacillus buchneri]
MKLAKKYLYSTILGLSLGVGMSTNVVKAAPSSNSAVVSPTSDPSKDEQANPDLSGKVEDVSYTVKDDQLTLYGGTIKKIHENFSLPWQQDGVRDRIKKLKIDGPLQFEQDGAYEFFEALGNLESISGLTNVDTSKTETLNYMFAQDGNLTSIDVSSFRTPNVITMSGLFFGDWKLEQVDLSNFDFSQLKNTDHMFGGDYVLTNITFPHSKASKIDNMLDMFYGNHSLKTLDLSDFDMTNVTAIGSMFSEDTLLSNLKLGPTFKNSALATLPPHQKGDEIPIDPLKDATGPGWQAVGANGTVNNPQGELYPTLEDFVAKRPAEDETYVWQQDTTPINQYMLNLTNSSASVYEGLQAKNWDPTSVIQLATHNGTDDKSAVTITDDNSQPVTQATIDALAPGTYSLTYQNGDQKQPFTLTIKADQASLKTTDIDLYLNQAFTEDVLKSKILAVNSDGQALPYTYTIKDATGKTVSLDDVKSKVGQYTVDIVTNQLLSGNEPLGGKLTINVTDSSTLNLKYGKLTIPVNQVWKPADAFDNAKDASGKDLAFKDILVTAKDSSGKIISDLSNLYKTPGVYTIHYSNGSASKDVQLTVTQPTPTPSPLPTPQPVPNPQPSPSPNPINPVTPTQPTVPTQPTNPKLPDYAVTKGAAVAAINNVYLYRTVNFTKGQRIAKYIKKPRIYRPMFVVTGYARSTSGKMRYHVRDVKHLSKTAGKTGYITDNWRYVRPIYYATLHKHITVISPAGVNAYKHKDLTGKVKSYQQGTILKVKGIVKHNLTTRYILTNGRYVTANRKLVNMGRHRTVKKVRAKTTIHRYQNVNLSGRPHTIKKGQIIKVSNYDYSHGHNLQKHGALRYRVAGGYITGNSKYVRIIR